MEINLSLSKLQKKSKKDKILRNSDKAVFLIQRVT